MNKCNNVLTDNIDNKNIICANNIKNRKRNCCQGISVARHGKLEEKHQCTKEALKNKQYCKFHEYMENYTEEMMNNLTRCRKCGKFYYIEGNDDRCDSCKKGNNKNKFRCNGKRVMRKTKDIVKCIDIVKNEADFCANHIYMKDYTEKMMNNLTVCTGCCKAYFLQHSKTCNNCQMRSNHNNKIKIDSESDKNIKTKEKENAKITDNTTNNKKQNIKIKEKCKAISVIETDEELKIQENVCSYNAKKDKDYCGKHEYQFKFKKDDYEKLRMCNNCKKIYIFKTSKSCDDCCDKIKIKIEKQKEKRHDRGFCKIICKSSGKRCGSLIFKNEMCKKHYEKYGEDNIEDINYIPEPKEGQKICSYERCKMPFDPYKTDTGKDAHQCKSCYEKSKLNEINRPERDRLDYYKEYESREETKQIRSVWKENNYDRIAFYNMDYRRRERFFDEDGYLEKRKNTAKIWRENNQEKMKQINKEKKKNFKCVLKNYIYIAHKKGVPWKFTDDEAFVYFTQPCFYCNEYDEDKLTGIDRVRLHYVYINDECVSACKMCNEMKINLDYTVFINICYHISVFNNKIEGKLMPEIFKDYNTVTNFDKFKHRSIKKFNLKFELSKEEYNKFILQNCYICGKTATENHKNSIDRFNNNIGYTKLNMRPCCTTCNYLKGELEYDIFINKCYKIACVFKDGLEEFKINFEKDNFTIVVRDVNLNKMTKEEYKKMKIESKVIRKERFVKKNTDEKLKERAIKIAENRKNNRITNI